MDFNDFWQENKRWVLMCVAGLLVFLIARSVVDSRFNAPAAVKLRTANGIYARMQSKKETVGREEVAGYYVGEHETSARELGESLGASLDRLRAAMHYELPERFDLTGKGDAELHRATVYNAVRNSVLERAAEVNVEFSEDAFSWQPQTERDLIQRELVGVSLVQHLVEQLVAAHRAVTGADFEALGLRAITGFQMDRTPPGARYRPAPRRGEAKVQAEDLVSEVGVKFKFEADHRTTHQFLENLRASSPKVILTSLKIVRGRRSGDPLKVEGEARAMTIKKLEAES